jgi:haloalkane dehalogenase
MEMKKNKAELPAVIREQYPFESRYLLLKEGRMHYVDEGQGFPVLMLHGNPTWSFFYRKLIQRLSPRMRVIAPDHLGCGLSDKPKDAPYNLKWHTDNIEQLIRYLGIETFDLVVHDWGGAIGTALALRMPHRVRRIIITNSAAFRSTEIPKRILLCKLPKIGAFLIQRLNVFVHGVLKTGVVNKLPKDVCKGYHYPYRSAKDRLGILRFVQDIPYYTTHPTYMTLVDMECQMQALEHHKVCLIWGMKDWCFTPSFLRTWRARFPKAKLHKLENAGHLLWEDGGPKAIDFVEEFLSEVKGSK